MFSLLSRRAAPADSLHSLLRVRDYRRYLTAMLISGLGDLMLLRVLGITLVAETGLSSAGGLVGLCLVLPSLAGPVLGTAADRIAPRSLFVRLSAIMAIVVLAAPIAVWSGQVWVLYLVAVAAGLASALTTAAESGAVAGLVPAPLLGRANAVLRTVAEGSRLVAPAAGTLLLYRWLGITPVAIVDSLSFLAVILIMPTIQAKVMTDPRASDGDGISWRAWTRQTAEGVRHLIHAAPLRPLLLGAFVAWAGIGFLETAIYSTVIQGLHQDPTFVVFLGVAQGIGAIPAGLAAGALETRWGSSKLAALGLGTVAAATLLMFLPLPGTVIAAAGLQSVGITWFFIGFGTALQQLTPSHLQGRTAGSAWAGLTVFQSTGIVLGAAAGLVFDYRALLCVIALGAAIGGVVTAQAPRPGARTES